MMMMLEIETLVEMAAENFRWPKSQISDCLVDRRFDCVLHSRIREVYKEDKNEG